MNSLSAYAFYIHFLPLPFYSFFCNAISGRDNVERTEIFARLFEQYVAFKLKQNGIANSFLTDTKYTRAVYMTPTELKRVVPYFDRLLVLMRGHF